MTYQQAMLALVAAGAMAVCACADNDVAPAASGASGSSPAASGPTRSGPATAGAPNTAPQGSDSSGKPVNPAPTAPSKP